MSDYNLSRGEWKRICGKRYLPYTKIEKNHIRRYRRKGVSLKKIHFSIRLKNSASGITHIFNPVNSRISKEKIKKRCETDEQYRKQVYQSTYRSMKKLNFRRRICLIARNITPEERIEFAEDMGFSKEWIEQEMKK